MWSGLNNTTNTDTSEMLLFWTLAPCQVRWWLFHTCLLNFFLAGICLTRRACLPGPTPGFLIWEVWGGTQELAFLVSSHPGATTVGCSRDHTLRTGIHNLIESFPQIYFTDWETEAQGEALPLTSSINVGKILNFSSSLGRLTMPTWTLLMAKSRPFHRHIPPALSEY